MNGLGAVTASVRVSLYAAPVRPVWFIIGGNTLFGVALVLFSLTSSFRLALLCLFFVGLGLLTQFSMMNTAIQSTVRDDIRGRVMSIYLLIFICLFPLGNLEIGYVADRPGELNAIRLGAAVVFLCGIVVFANRHRIRAQARDGLIVRTVDNAALHYERRIGNNPFALLAPRYRIGAGMESVSVSRMRSIEFERKTV